MIPNPNTENFPFLGGLESHGPLILFGTDQEVRAVNYKRSSLFIFLFLSQALRLQIGRMMMIAFITFKSSLVPLFEGL